DADTDAEQRLRRQILFDDTATLPPRTERPRAFHVVETKATVHCAAGRRACRVGGAVQNRNPAGLGVVNDPDGPFSPPNDAYPRPIGDHDGVAIARDDALTLRHRRV